jgi:hypothetical protein
MLTWVTAGGRSEAYSARRQETSAVRATSCFPNHRASNISKLSPNRKRHIARVAIWCVAATALLAELSLLAAERLV